LSLLAIAIFKKPGQHGVIESQTMDMTNMRPPVGAVPVAVASVQMRTVQQVVTYTGTVRAFTDEDVVARTSGRISAMHVYPGDRVRRGQLLVQLDDRNSEYSARAEEARLGGEAAQHNVRIAEQEREQRTEEAEAQAAQLKQMQQEVADAKANLEYWQKEIVREEKLLRGQVISKDEYDKELAQYKSAKAKLGEAGQRVAESKEKLEAAREAIDVASHHITHQEALARQARATARVAAIIESYTRMTASDNGVVTERVVSPGVLVSPGQVLLRIAHIDRVRMQASVASVDAGRARIGDPVVVRATQDGPIIATTAVSAVFPAADPSARTTIVEAIVPNPGYRLIPGQYVVMDIATDSRTALSVPNSAIVWLNGQANVWRVANTTPRIAQLVAVTTGLSDRLGTEVTAGLRPGDLVIYKGQADLQPGTPVVPTEWTTTGPKALPSVEQTGALRLEASNKWLLTHGGKQYIVELTMSNIPVNGGNNALVVTVKDKAGKPLPGIPVDVKFSMPAMNMGGPEVTGQTGGDGKVPLSGHFMSGPWHAEITVGTKAQENFAVDIEVL
jgi:multidrug efflux pump subunit AcrA (membrane-fusion protein)